MKRVLFFVYVFLINSVLSWGQTWDVTETMTATLDNKGVLTISTTANAEAMPDYSHPAYWPYSSENRPVWWERNSDILSIIIDDNVTTIGEYAFYLCNQMTSITISNTVTTIGNWAFSACYQFASVTIPNSVTTIGEGVFVGCSNLTSIQVDAENSAYSSDTEGVLYNKNKTVLHTFPAAKSGKFTIPFSVTEIGDWAFFGSKHLTAIKIPDLVTSFGYNCFAYCDSLFEFTVAWKSPLPLSVDDFGFNSPIESFSYTYIRNATLYVPIGTKALYEVAEVWELFKTIVEYDPTNSNKNMDVPTLKVFTSNGILHITGLQPDSPLSIYNLAGQLVFNSTPKKVEMHIPIKANGIYIVVTENQTIKVIVK